MLRLYQTLILQTNFAVLSGRALPGDPVPAANVAAVAHTNAQNITM